MQSNERDRAGRFFLKMRGKQRIWYICWYNAATGQADRLSTGTSDRETARSALYEHALRGDRPAHERDAQLATVMQTCWLQYAQHLPSAQTHLAAQRDALEAWGDITVQELDRRKQLHFVAVLRARGLSDWTISTRLARIWAMMNWYKRDNPQLLVPEQITAADWKPVLSDCEQTFSLDELAALLDACREPQSQEDPIPPSGSYGHVAAVVRAALREMPDAFSIDQLEAALRTRDLKLGYKPLLRAVTEQLAKGNMS